MEDLIKLAALINQRNLLEVEITVLIDRPAGIGHIGEYIASKIFNIELEKSASHKGIDGHFNDGGLQGRTVNIKWYAKREGLLAITLDSPPDYYLVMTGPKSVAMTSRGVTRPWIIENVFLFDSQSLADELQRKGLQISVATSVQQHFWAKAEIYPTPANNTLELTESQREALALFSSRTGG